MTYNFDTLFQEFISDPITKHCGPQTPIGFVTYCSLMYNDAIDDGIEPDPMCVWVLGNHPCAPC